MTGWLILFSNIAAGSVRAIIGFFLIDRLLAINKPDKNSVKWKFNHSDLSVLQGGRMGVSVVIAVGIVVISVILFLTGLSDLYRMVSEIVWLAVCTSYFQSADTGACSNNHSRHLYNDANASHSPSSVVVAPNSGYIRHIRYAFASYASFIWQIISKMIDAPTNCDAHPAKSIFQAHFRMGLFVSIFYEIAISLCQFLVAAWSGVIFHLSAFLDYGTVYGQISVWLFHALMIAGALYVGKRPNMTGKEAFHLASSIVVIAFIAVVTLSQQTILPIADDTLDMWTILAVVLMMSVLVFNMNRQYEVEKELARLKTEQAELLERDYTTLNNAYAINAKVFHDFHNHIGLLRQLLSHAKLEEAIQYLDELQTPVQEMTKTVWTGDETVDYIINSKAVTAKERNVQYQVQVEFPRHTNLRSVDLCAVLGNLLDNALEAAGQVPEKEKRFVRLTIRRINQMLIIKVENSFHKAPISQDGVLTTSKEKNGLHGWGLKSAQAAAEKYDGTVQTSYKDKVFKAVATLSLG